MSRYKNGNTLYDIWDEYNIKDDLLSWNIKFLTADNIFCNYDQNATAEDIAKQRDNIVNVDIQKPFYTQRELPYNMTEHIKNESGDVVGFLNKTILPYVMFFTIDIWNYTERLAKLQGESEESFQKRAQAERLKEMVCKVVKEKMKNSFLQNHYFVDLEIDNETELDDDTNLKQNHFILKVRKVVFSKIIEEEDVCVIEEYPSLETIHIDKLLEK